MKGGCSLGLGVGGGRGKLRREGGGVVRRVGGR